MAITMAHMSSTPGAGPSFPSSAVPMSRSTSNSSHTSSNPLASDDEEEWIGPFRAELRRNQQARLAELLQQAENVFQEKSNMLAARRSHFRESDWLSDGAYESAMAKLIHAFDAQKRKVRRVLEEEEEALVERERGLRKLSLGGKLESEEEEALVREQEELYRMYQAQARRTESRDANDVNTRSTASASGSAQRSTWVPPAKAMSAQKSNASQAPTFKLDRKGSIVPPQTSSHIADALFPSRGRDRSPTTRYDSWDGDTSFSHTSVLHSEPEEMSDTEDNRHEQDPDNEDGDDESGSDYDGSNSDDGISSGGAFLLAAERSFGAVPAKTAPLNIARGGSPHPNSRGRGGMTGRTPPSAMPAPFTTSYRQQPVNQNLNRSNSDAHHILWKPSRENMSSAQARGPEESWGRARARSSTSSAGGLAGTSASPPVHGLQQIWHPSMTATSGGNANTSFHSTASIPAANSSASSTAIVNPYRRRNDSDTSGAGSPARRPSQTQSFTQPLPSPKTSLPVPTPSPGFVRRSPAPSSEVHTPPPSIPTPSSSFSNNRSFPFASSRRPASPPPVSTSTNLPGSSLSRYPTEILEPSPNATSMQEKRPNKSASQIGPQSRMEDYPDQERSAAVRPSRSFNEGVRNSPSTSALSERMQRERERDIEDRKQKEREDKVNRQAEELRQQDAQQRKREAQLTARARTYDDDVVEQQGRTSETQRNSLSDKELEERDERSETTRELREFSASQLVREEAFAYQKRVLEEQRQNEANMRQQTEQELEAKEAELNDNRQMMQEWLRVRQEEEIAAHTRQLELQKKREADLEEQQRILDAQIQAERREAREKEEKLRKDYEELKRRHNELLAEQRKKDEREREEALRKQQEEERAAEERRKEEELRAKEDQLKRQEWEINQREEAYNRRKKEEALRAREDELERQRRLLQQREEELARREAEDEQRRVAEERMRKEKEMAVRRQQDEDKKRLEIHVSKKLEKEREKEREEREARERQWREREERERERKEMEALKEQERRARREWENEQAKQAELEQRANDIERRRKEDEESRRAAEIKQQEELLQYYAQRKLHDEAARKVDSRGAPPSSSFSHSILNPSGAFSSAPAAHSSGRATSSASSIHSNWSGRSSASSASSAASDFSRASAASSASSAWSTNSRPSAPTSSSSSTSNRTAKADSHKTKPSAWKAPNTGTGAPPSASAGTNPHAAGPPEDEAEWQRRQEEFSRKQQEKFRQDSLKQEQERMVNAATKSQTTQIHDAWKAYEAEWSSLNDRPVLYFMTFPWPIVGSPQKPEDLTKAAISAFMLAGPSPGDSALDKTRERIRVQQLRWHPDRFNPRWLSKVDPHDRDVVQGSVVEVAGVLNELKEIVARKIAEQAQK